MRASSRTNLSEAQFKAAQVCLSELARLGPWFHVNDLVRATGIPSEAVNRTLANWTKIGAIKPLGGRSHLHHNSACFPEASMDVRQALAKAVPKWINASNSILMRHGIWTQHTKSLRLVGAASDPTYKIDDVEFSTRKRPWLSALHKAKAIRLEGPMLALTPAAVLADVLIHDPASAPHPDDLDFHGIDDKDAVRFFELTGFLLPESAPKSIGLGASAKKGNGPRAMEIVYSVELTARIRQINDRCEIERVDGSRAAIGDFIRQGGPAQGRRP